MGLDVYFRSDVANILRAVAKTDRSAQAVYFENDGEFQSAYHLGFQAALTAVGLGFGLEPMIDQSESRGPIWIDAVAREGDV
jgi:hypothetical protein